jgi:hypothetical protein
MLTEGTFDPNPGMYKHKGYMECMSSEYTNSSSHCVCANSVYLSVELYVYIKVV